MCYDKESPNIFGLITMPQSMSALSLYMSGATLIFTLECWVVVVVVVSRPNTDFEFCNKEMKRTLHDDGDDVVVYMNIILMHRYTCVFSLKLVVH